MAAAVDVDPVAEWTAAQERVTRLVGGAADPEVRVPACPDWTVRQLLAHMVGLDVDVLRGDEPDDHNATWTQKQVDDRADQDVASILAEWGAITGALQEWMKANGPRPLADVVIHEQDLRSALGEPGARDTPGMAAVRQRMADGLTRRVADAGLPALRLESSGPEAPGWSLVAGTGEPAAVVRASGFDLARALTTRRSAEQLRSWTVSGDIGPYLELFASLGPLPTTALPE